VGGVVLVGWCLVGVGGGSCRRVHISPVLGGEKKRRERRKTFLEGSRTDSGTAWLKRWNLKEGRVTGGILRWTWSGFRGFGLRRTESSPVVVVTPQG